MGIMIELGMTIVHVFDMYYVYFKVVLRKIVPIHTLPYLPRGENYKCTILP
jgi:hypothetical protein